MIVRIAGEGQYRFPGALMDHLKELDRKIVEAVANEDEAEFHKLYAQMVSQVKSEGKPVAHEEIVESEIILPPSDITFREAKNLFVRSDPVSG
ncbi:MAG: PspA-associated protein PspAA [Syntrophobacteraceae bacterium]